MKGILLQKRNKKGFTLVELVIVVAVLAIIAGIAIPTVHNVIDSANKAADDSNAQAIEMAIKTCQSELAAKETNGISDSLSKVINDEKKELITLLNAYGVNLDLSMLKQSGYEYYYDSISGKVIANSAIPKDTNYKELKLTATYAISGSTLTIDPDGKAD